jgi:hypothetical protein
MPPTSGVIWPGNDSPEETVADQKLGEILYPRNCRVGVSPDKSQLAFTFTSPTHSPITLVLPLAGAVGLQQKLARSLIMLGVQPLPSRRQAAAAQAKSPKVAAAGAAAGQPAGEAEAGPGESPPAA